MTARGHKFTLIRVLTAIVAAAVVGLSGQWLSAGAWGPVLMAGTGLLLAVRLLWPRRPRHLLYCDEDPACHWPPLDERRVMSDDELESAFQSHRKQGRE